MALQEAVFGPVTITTTDPTVNDDESQGFGVGAAWINTTTDEVFVCASSVAGAAVWKSITIQGGGSGDVATDVIWDAKGDLAVGTGADTAIRLAAGADNALLQAIASEATGLIWRTIPQLDAIADLGGTTRIDIGTTTPHVAITGNLDVSGRMAIGSAAIHTARNINIDETFTGVASTHRGISSVVYGNTTSGVVEIASALYFEGRVGGATGSSFYIAQGMAGFATLEGGGNAFSLAGAEVGIQTVLGSTGSIISEAYTLYSRSVRNSATPKSPTTWGIKMDDFSPWGGAGQTVYGIQIARFDADANPTRWPFFYGDHGGTEYVSIKEVAGGPIFRVPQYTDATRPTAENAGAGAIIYNSTDGGLNISNGANWRAPSGGWVNT